MCCYHKGLRMTRPEIAVLLSTYERPQHLQRSLLSLALQQGVAGQMEVIVTDDGSGTELEDCPRVFGHRGFSRPADDALP